ncbi:hypothetical protein BH18ACT1_BH18ACT1_01440 [soil metagenome]
MLGLLGAAADGAVLDVGCGPSQYRCRLDAAGGLRVGLDLSEGMTAIAKGRAPAANIVCGDASALPFTATTFDAVLASSGRWRARTHVGAFVCRRPSR